MRISAALVPVLALALTVTACSSSSKGKGTAVGTTGASTATTSTSTTAAPTTNAAAAPNEAALKKLVLTAADVPSDWKASPPSSSSNSPEDAASQVALAACLGIPNSDKMRVASADSDDFDLDNSSISSNATSYSSQDAVDQDAAALSKSNATSCFKQGLQKALTAELPSGATVDKFDITITPGSGNGPNNVAGALHVSVVVTVSGQQAHVYLDIFLIKGKLIEGSVQFTGFGAPISDAIETKAVKAVADRVAAA